MESDFEVSVPDYIINIILHCVGTSAPIDDDSDKENPDVTDSSPLFAARKRTKKSVSARAPPPSDPTPVSSRTSRRKASARR